MSDYVQSDIFLDRSLAERTVHVETDGSDSTGNGSADAPFASLNGAAEKLPDSIDHIHRVQLGSGTFETANTLVAKLNQKIVSPQVKQYFFINGTWTELLSEKTADSGTRDTLTDTGAFAGQDYSGKFVELLEGPNVIPSTYYWFTNIFPIMSNTDDVLTLGCKLSSNLSSSTHYRIVEPATIFDGEATNNDLGTNLYGPQSLEFHMVGVRFTKSYFGSRVFGRAWFHACEFIMDTVGYSGLLVAENGYAISDGCIYDGAWSNAQIGLNFGQTILARQNLFRNGKSAIENDSGNYLFDYGNKIDEMTDYAYKSINTGLIKGSDNANTGTVVSNIDKQVCYAVNGGKIIIPLNSGTVGLAEIARFIGPSSVIYESDRMTATLLATFDDAAGSLVDRSTGVEHKAFESKVYPDSVTTTDATVTTLFAFDLAEGEAVDVEVNLFGKEGDTNRLTHRFKGSFYRAAAGNVTQQGATQDIAAINQSGAWVGGTLNANAATQQVEVQAAGAIGATVVWTPQISFKKR